MGAALGQLTRHPSSHDEGTPAVIEETGTALFALRIDVTAGPIAEAIRVHWDLNT